MSENDITGKFDCKENIDPSPLSIILELANLIIQPGSLALIAAGSTAIIQYKTYKQLSDSNRSKIRSKLYEIDRALNDGFNSLMTLASLLDQFNYLETKLKIGAGAVKGYKNAQKLRRAHEDCRAAVKDARDAFIELSGLLPADHGDDISEALDKLNNLYEPLITNQTIFARSLITGTYALHVVDELICKIGREYDYKRSPRSFTNDLLNSIPTINRHSHNGNNH